MSHPVFGSKLFEKNSAGKEIRNCPVFDPNSFESNSEVIEMAPEFSEGWNRRATVRYYQKDFEGSLDDIQQTLILEPRHFGAVWGLGMILGWKQDFSGAIIAFERLLEINPHARDARPRIEILKQELAKSAV